MFHHYDRNELEANNQTTMEYLEDVLGDNIHDETSINICLRDAARLGHIEIVKNLTEVCKKCEYDYKENSLPALLESAKNGEFEIMKYLVEQGADVKANEAFEHSDSAIQLAAMNGHKESSVFLVKNGADPKEAMNYGTEEVKRAVADQQREAIAERIKKFSLPSVKKNIATRSH